MFGGLFGGGGGGSSSSTNQTWNIDKRLAVGEGSLANSGDNVTFTVTDGGIAARAFDSIDVATALSADGYKQLLDASLQMFNKSEGLIGQTQQSVAAAYSQAQQEKGAALDNRTIMVLGIAGAAALVMMVRK